MFTGLLKKIFKTRNKKDELESAAENFDELMGKVTEDEQDLSQLEHHMREEWDEINKDVNKVKDGVDEVVNKKAA